MIYISGPGHGGNAIVSNTYLEGSYSEVYPNITRDEEGMKNYLNNLVFQVEFHPMLLLKRQAQ